MGRLILPDETAFEGKTPLDNKEGLLVDARTQDELNAYEFANISKTTTRYLLRIPSTKKAPFIYEWFLKIHKEMFGDVWEWAGKIRRTNKNIGIDKIQIHQALKGLEKDYHYWLTSKMNTDEIAARLHHRLVQIHPFENGNGRWARLITNIYLKQADLPLIEWPDKALLARTDIRKRYLEALRQADQHNLRPLMELHRELQKR